MLFQNLPKKLEVGRYHSLVVSNEDFPEELEITAVGPKGEVMALRHKNVSCSRCSVSSRSIL